MTSSASRHVLGATDLNVGWHGKTVANFGSFELQQGEIAVIAGPNGVGKSTTVKTLARQIKPLAGKVILSGADIWSLSASEFARGVAYVPQTVDAPHSMLVRDMVAMGRNPHQMWWSWQSTQADHSAVEAALEATETAKLALSEVGTLSGGELQRVALAVALAQQSQFIILDEPTSHLDYKHQLQLLSLLKQLKQQPIGILLVLHDLNLIGRLADRVFLLAKSGADVATVAACGSPAQVFVSSKLQQVYEIEVAVVEDAGSGITSYIPLVPKSN